MNVGALAAAGLVDISAWDATIRIDLRYATADNFTGRPLYPAGTRCWLHETAATRLLRVQRDLAAQGLGLKVYDAYRPFAVQKALWRVVPDARFIAEPVERDGRPLAGSRHNRGAAVDVTLVDRDGYELPMPCAFDDFGPAAHRDHADCPDDRRAHRGRLAEAMLRHGFASFEHEWWHFDAPGWETLPLLDLELSTGASPTARPR